ncbi:hypothetical protein [Azovibrio restrictus]|uniref:hypothetical protein n=1 Tax=Azovibrio restrictus TaxID=146938 RepID=UPI0003F9009F|nr:hypothetical protein [Azovibrio restrictus]
MPFWSRLKAAASPGKRTPGASLRTLLRQRLLILAWDVGGLSGVVAEQGARDEAWQLSPPVCSGITDFGHALDEVLAHLLQEGVAPPRHCWLLSRLVVPALVDLPVDPESPRPAAQMRELVRSEMEPVVAEFGALWSLGAVLEARGLIDAAQREQVVLELAVRREQSGNPVSFGRVALELEMISQSQLEDALKVQESLQMLESDLACGWAGHVPAEGQTPVWLACATGLSTWEQWERACRQRNLRLVAASPLAWAASETPGESESRMALEIHGEDVVAVLRHRGHVASARSEGRLERPLAADWLGRLIQDWRAMGIQDLELVCLEKRDEPTLQDILEQIGTRYGHAPQLRDYGQTWQALLQHQAGQFRQRQPALPLIREGRPAKPLVRRPGFWHLLLPCLTLAALGGLEAWQRWQIHKLETHFATIQATEKKNLELAQTTIRFNQEMQQVKKDLDQGRQQLARLLTEVERLQTIEAMGAHLPRLLRTLARGVGDQVVLESVHNAKVGTSDMNRIRVTGWSPDYGAAQAFALRVQELVSQDQGYGVANTDVSARPGREGKPGYGVSFWLVPVEEDLEGTHPLEKNQP